MSVRAGLSKRSHRDWLRSRGEGDVSRAGWEQDCTGAPTPPDERPVPRSRSQPRGVAVRGCGAAASSLGSRRWTAAPVGPRSGPAPPLGHGIAPFPACAVLGCWAAHRGARPPGVTLQGLTASTGPVAPAPGAGTWPTQGAQACLCLSLSQRTWLGVQGLERPLPEEITCSPSLWWPMVEGGVRRGTGCSGSACRPEGGRWI